VLSINQVRYCVNQGERIELLRALASDDMVDPFNALVRDYNMRCSSFRYYERDLESVQHDLPLIRVTLKKDAQDIAASWQSVTSTMPSIPSTTSNQPPPAPNSALLDPSYPADAIIIQTHLKALGYYTGLLDGAFGNASRAALTRFQLAKGLLADGEWDLLTQQALIGP
jgi:hypothetical protein